MVLDLVSNAFLLAAGSCTGLCSTITSPYIIGTALAMVGVMLVITVLAILYMLSPAFGNNQLRPWIRTKIYDELASIVFIFIFLAFGALVATLPVQGSLNAAGLTNSECTSAINNPPASHPGQTVSYDNLYFVSLCDVYQFNSDVALLSESTFYVASIVSLDPVININLPKGGGTAILPTVVGGGGGGAGAPVAIGQFQNPTDADAGPGPIPTGSWLGGNVGLVLSFDLMPIQPVFHYFVPLLNTLYLFFVLSQVQLLLISASGLIYAVLMAVGLVARSFGITRTFGGAMIAFALGIGVIYPLMTAITYGFMTHAIDGARTDFACAFSFGLSQNFGINSCPAPYNHSGVVSNMLNLIVTWGVGTFAAAGGVGGIVFANSILPLFIPLFRAYVIFGGLISIGLAFIPLLSLTVVDVFIVDFSQAIGERMDFLSLLTRLV